MIHNVGITMAGMRLLIRECCFYKIQTVIHGLDDAVSESATPSRDLGCGCSALHLRDNDRTFDVGVGLDEESKSDVVASEGDAFVDTLVKDG